MVNGTTPATSQPAARYGRYGARRSKQSYLELLRASGRATASGEPRPTKPCLDCGYQMLDFLTMCPKCNSSQWQRGETAPAPPADPCESCGATEGQAHNDFCG